MATNINFEDDDDDFTNFQETAVLSRVVKSQAKYGSTASHSFANQKFISHQVQPSDTLQGMSSCLTTPSNTDIYLHYFRSCTQISSIGKFVVENCELKC